MNDRNERILTKLSVFFHGFVRALSGKGGRIGSTGCRENSRIKVKTGVPGESPDIRKTVVLFMESEELSPP